jgi:hypothetical protein
MATTAFGTIDFINHETVLQKRNVTPLHCLTHTEAGKGNLFSNFTLVSFSRSIQALTSEPIQSNTDYASFLFIFIISFRCGGNPRHDSKVDGTVIEDGTNNNFGSAKELRVLEAAVAVAVMILMTFQP